MKDMNMNMKIWKKTAAFTAVALATGLVACTDDLGMGNSQAMDPSEVVCFTTGSTVGESREPFTRHAGYLEETAEEWELTGKESPTRAAVETSLYDYFDNAGVRIFMYDGDWSTSNTTNFQVPYPDDGPLAAEFTGMLLNSVPALPGTFNSDGLLSPVTPILWSKTKSIHKALDGNSQYFEHFRAYAFAPLTGTEKNRYHGINNLSAAGYTVYNHGDIGVPPSITYTVPDEPADQVDLIAACTGELDGDLCSTVPMTFRHVLSTVEFRLGFEQTTKVKSLTISGVYKKGTGSFNDSNELMVVSDADGNGNGTPGEVDDLYTYSFTWKNGGEEYKEYEWDGDHFTSGNVLTDGDNTLMMMPQTLPEGAYVTLVYCVQDGGGGSYGSDKTITCDISGFTWKAGHRYIYTIKEEPSYSIFFDLAAGPVDINNTTYSGYVYVDGVATTVSGSHVASNKYYVYQSTGTTTGEFSGVLTGGLVKTGYTSETWNGGSPSVMPIIPEYEEVMSPDGSKTWVEYLTNNPKSEDVFEKWPTVDKKGRTSTINRIWIRGTESSPTALKVDMTIDNIWSLRYGGGTDPGTNFNVFGGIVIGSGTGTSTSNIKPRDQVTLRLKGLNKVQHVQVDGRYYLETYDPDLSPYLSITSYYGDKSNKGSLIVMRETDTALAHGQSVFNSLGDNFVNDVRFLGGTIYVATPTNPTANFMTGCLGGGVHGPAEILVDGATLTAVAHSSGAAIGGGLGGSGYAGDGTVTIKSGKVYAYQFGTPVKAGNLGGARHYISYCLTSTAIGGGSTSASFGNTGKVTITGGEVYAQSVGGVAIGGGASGQYKGGDAYIYIGGNANVIAKSIPGTIYGYYVTGGTSVGGGNGGNEAIARRLSPTVDARYVADGGNAEVIIEGGRLITGSIGGGNNGKDTDNPSKTFLIGKADVSINNAYVQGQAVMADINPSEAPLPDGSNKPSFHMLSGTLSLINSNEFYFVRDNGGAVWMDSGNCNIEGGTISDFNAQNGGAVYMEGGTFNMSGGTIQNCRAQYNSTTGLGGNGGAVYINDATGAATVNITGGTITNNYADWNGGAVYLEGGNVNISGGTMKVNSALGVPGISATERGNGGGVYLMEGNLTMSGGVVSGNKATRNGGGLYVSSSSQNITVNITGGEITGNVAENYGAGLFVLPKAGLSATVNIGIDDATYSRLLPKITGNSASLRGGGIYAQSTSGDPANPNAVLNLYDGKIKDNSVSAYVYNQSVTNEGGSVTLALDDDGKPVPDLDYITVTIDPAGGDFTDGNTSADPAYRYLVKASNSTLAIPTPKRKNFRFIGWLPSQGEADTGVAVYTDGMTLNYDKDLTLTAQWELAN